MRGAARADRGVAACLHECRLDEDLETPTLLPV